MAKTSTQFSIASFVSQNKKNLKEDPSLEFNPSEAVIKNILSFSKALKIEKSQNTGLIEIVLN